MKLYRRILNFKRQMRLRKILTVLQIPITPWQGEFILKVENPQIPASQMGRRTGKTTAVLLRCMVWDPETPDEIIKKLKRDPDLHKMRDGTYWICREYEKWVTRCKRAGVKFKKDGDAVFVHLRNRIA